jgi:hypothetical protein
MILILFVKSTKQQKSKPGSFDVTQGALNGGS